MLHEPEALVVQQTEVLADERVEEGVVGLVVCQGHQERAHDLRQRGGGGGGGRRLERGSF